MERLLQESSPQPSPLKSALGSAPHVDSSPRTEQSGAGAGNAGRTPRARYNSALIRKLQRSLELNPEADLTPRISSYSSKRLKELRGASTIISPKKNVPQETKRVQPPVPEPRGNFCIISPLARQVEMLICPNPLDPSSQISYPASTFWSALRHGKVLLNIMSKWVIKISESIVVKFASGV